MPPKDADEIANSEDHDQTAPPGLGLHVLPKYVCCKIQDHYGTCS